MVCFAQKATACCYWKQCCKLMSKTISWMTQKHWEDFWVHWAELLTNAALIRQIHVSSHLLRFNQWDRFCLWKVFAELKPTFSSCCLISPALSLSLPLCFHLLLSPLISPAVAWYNVNEPLSTEPMMVSALSLVSGLIRSLVQLTFTRLLCWLALHAGHMGQNNTQGNFNNPNAFGKEGSWSLWQDWMLTKSAKMPKNKAYRGHLD